MKRVAALLLSASVLLGQMPIEDQRKLAREYLAADDAGARKLEPEIEKLPALSKSEAKAWTDWVKKQLRTVGPKLDAEGDELLLRQGRQGEEARQVHRRGRRQPEGTGVRAPRRRRRPGRLRRRGELVAVRDRQGGNDRDLPGGDRGDGSRVGRRRHGEVHPRPPRRRAADVHVRSGSRLRRRPFDGRLRRVDLGRPVLGPASPAVVSFAGAPTPIFDDDKKVTGIQPGVLPNLFNVPIWVYHSADDPQVPIAPTRFAVQELQGARGPRIPAATSSTTRRRRSRGTPSRRRARTRRSPGWRRRSATRSPQQDRLAGVLRPPGPEQLLARLRRAGARLDPAGLVGRQERVRGEGRRGGREGRRVLLNDAMCDLDRPVTVTIGGKASAAVPKRSLAMLLRSARRRWDPNLLFVACVRS